MADEALITPEAETIAPTGTASEVLDTKEANAETVPLHVYLAAKDDKKQAKQESLEKDKRIADLESQLNSRGTQKQEFADMRDKYPDVSEDFINDMLSAATQKAKSEIEQEYKPRIAQLEARENNKKLDNLVDEHIKLAKEEGASLPKTLDKELLKELIALPKYRNTPVKDILKGMYPVENTGRATTENDMRPASDRAEDVVNTEDLRNISAEQRANIMAHPVTRQKYFDALDRMPNR